MKLLHIFLFLAIFSGGLVAEEQAMKWPHAITNLFGSWESNSIEVKDLAVKSRFSITFQEDGTFITKFFKGEREGEELKGVYAVGRDYIYLWSGGPPSDDVDVDPKEYYRALLMSYKFDGGQLKVEFLEGSRTRQSYTLKKIKKQNKAEMATPRKPSD
jgi:hypothetical protein